MLSAAVLLLARGAQSSAANPVCASNSVPFCWVGTATGGIISASAVRVTPLSSETGTYRPMVDGAVCNCFNATSPSGDITYGFADAASLQIYSGNSQLGVAKVCSSQSCNCGVAGCPIDPVATGKCPATGSAGPLACRIGTVGTYAPWVNDAGVLTGPTLTFTAATPGNLASLNFTAGSVCIAEQFSASTTYANTTVQGCISDFYYFTYNTDSFDGGSASILSNLTACTTNNCGAPAATGPVCPTSSSAARCIIGMTGPSAAATALNTWLSSPDRYNATSSAAAPSSQPVPAGSACIAFTQPCSAHQQETITNLNAVTCPLNQSITVFMAMPALPVLAPGDDWYFEPPPYCNTVLTDFGVYNSTGFVACGTTDCNAATATTYLAASAVLGGYTTTTFGTLQAGQFAYGMATALALPYSAVTVTSVAAAATRRSLLAAGVNVGFTVKATVTTSKTLGAALAAPISATVLQGAGLSAVTSVAITPVSNAAAPVAIVASALPNTGVYNAPSSGAAQPAGMMATALALAAAAMLA